MLLGVLRFDLSHVTHTELSWRVATAATRYTETTCAVCAVSSVGALREQRHATHWLNDFTWARARNLKQ